MKMQKNDERPKLVCFIMVVVEGNIEKFKTRDMEVLPIHIKLSEVYPQSQPTAKYFYLIKN